MQRKLIGGLMIICGLAAMGLAVFMILPVGVNLPESWFGVVWIILFGGVGVWLVYKGGAWLLYPKSTNPDSPQS
jgi:hypothetical protein